MNIEGWIQVIRFSEYGLHCDKCRGSNGLNVSAGESDSAHAVRG